MDYKRKRKIVIGISLFILLVFYLFKNISESVRVFGFIIGVFVFYFLDHMFNLEFKFRHYVYITIILAFGILLSPLYFLYGSYDKLLHFLMPILGSLIVFHIADRQKLNLQWKLLVTFMFMISFLAIHEIGEYLLDLLYDFKLQGVYVRDIAELEKLNLVQSKNDDTMIDMILGMLGTGLFIIGKTGIYFYKKFTS